MRINPLNNSHRFWGLVPATEWPPLPPLLNGFLAPMWRPTRVLEPLRAVDSTDIIYATHTH